MFCVSFGSEALDYFKTANGNTITVTLHIATLLRSHFQRQFIGNSIPIVIFRELKNKKEFQPLSIHKMKTLGLFPQFFIVVEPHGTNQYKYASFLRCSWLVYFLSLVLSSFLIYFRCSLVSFARLSFFKKKTLKFFFPFIHNIIIDKSQLRDVLYTKSMSSSTLILSFFSLFPFCILLVAGLSSFCLPSVFFLLIGVLFVSSPQC
jgi:hypothetical protein